MTVRKPIVQVNGVLGELPLGDLLPSGSVDTPFFAADLDSTDQTGLTLNATNLVNFSHTREDPIGWFDTILHRFVPKQAGIYMIILGVALNVTGTSTDGPQAYIYKNGSLLVNGSYAGVPGGVSGESSIAFGLVRLNGTTDYVEGRCFVASGTNSFRGGISQTFFQGFRVGN